MYGWLEQRSLDARGTWSTAAHCLALLSARFVSLLFTPLRDRLAMLTSMVLSKSDHTPFRKKGGAMNTNTVWRHCLPEEASSPLLYLREGKPRILSFRLHVNLHRSYFFVRFVASLSDRLLNVRNSARICHSVRIGESGTLIQLTYYGRNCLRNHGKPVTRVLNKSLGQYDYQRLWKQHLSPASSDQIVIGVVMIDLLSAKTHSDAHSDPLAR